jgi:undecaprenyl-diphosphatase
MMRSGIKSGLAIGMAGGISIIIKKIINRPRPFVTYPNDVTQRTKTGPYSFPSGHSTAAFATATALSLSTKKWEIAVPSFAYAAMVAYSRMRLGVHYPSDVLAGSAIGIGSGFIVWQADKWFRKRQASKKSRIAE